MDVNQNNNKDYKRDLNQSNIIQELSTVKPEVKSVYSIQDISTELTEILVEISQHSHPDPKTITNELSEISDLFKNIEMTNEILDVLENRADLLNLKIDQLLSLGVEESINNP